MSDRISSGDAGLDEVLGGGLPAYAINLIMGLPGTGKTLLAQQCVFRNATSRSPALYLSSTSEPFEKILRYGQRLSFFDPARVGHDAVYEELGTTLTHHGLQAALEQIRESLRRHRPGLLVIDSFKALTTYGGTLTEVRNELHELAGTLSAFPVTSLWLGEYSEQEMATAPEFAVADSVIQLASRPDQQRASRAVQVLKLRGGDFRSGQHAYRLSPDGMTVYPRLADPADSEPYIRDRARVSSGIQALDDMLADGYRTGSSTLIAGPTGIGKTMMGLHFLFGGAQQGEHGVLATLQEDPTQLEHAVRGFGWSLAQDEVTLLYRSPVDLYVDQWVYELLGTVEKTGASRVFIDALTDVESATGSQHRFAEYLYSLLRRFSRRNVSTMMSYEVGELSGIRRVTSRAASNVADNVVVLEYDKRGGTVGRTLSVLKTRASAHAAEVRWYDITPRGIVLTAMPATAEPMQDPAGDLSREYL